MTRCGYLPALALVALLRGGVASCSRGSHTADDGPVAPARTGIPAAATSARVVTPESTAPSASAPVLGTLGGSSGGGPVSPHVPPHIHDDGASVSSAAIPPEVIRRIVRQNFGRFRLCYESGLRLDPTLAGSVRTRFLIEPDGAVGTVSDAGSLLPDAGVVSCVQHAFALLSFPEPAGGVSITVTYSLSFTGS